MNVRISRHIFGCIQGYQTLAVSGDLDRSEIGELETFSFGQTNAAGYLDSLQHDPAYWCRCLRSGRWALTRVLKGKPDDKGRSTLLFVSALLDSSEWVGALGADATPLLNCDPLWSWNGKSVVAPVKLEVAVPDRAVPIAAQRARVLSMLALVESRHGNPNETIVTSEHQFSPEDVRLLAALLPHASRESFSYAVRSLSEGLPVTINCLAGSASHGASDRRIIRWSRTASYDPPVYASAVAFFWKTASAPPWEFIANCRTFGEATRVLEAGPTPRDSFEGAVSPPARARSTRLRPFRVNGYVALGVVLVILVGATGYSVVRVLGGKEAHAARVRHTQEVLDDVRAFLRENPRGGPLARNRKEREQLIQSGETLRERREAIIHDSLGESDEPDPREDLQELRDWLVFAREMHDTQVRIEKVLEEFSEFKRKVDDDFPSDDRRVRSDILNWRIRIRHQQEITSSLGSLYEDELTQAVDKLDEWERRIDEQDLQGLLAEFETFATSAGLYELGETDAYPSDEIRQGADDWKGRLGSGKDARLRDALGRLVEWEAVCGRIILNCQGVLRSLGEYYGQEAPKLLGKDLLDDFSEAGARLDDLEGRIGHVSQQPGLIKELQVVRGKAEARTESIDELRSSFTTDYDLVEQLIEKHELDLSLPEARHLKQPWEGARDAKRRCESALLIWPKHEGCSKKSELITKWLNAASLDAHKYFRLLVDEAGRASRLWRQQAVDDRGEPPPFAVLNIAEAMEYYHQMRDAIEQRDTNNEYIQKATYLEGQLKEEKPSADELP